MRVRATLNGKEIFPKLHWPILKTWPRVTSKPILAKLSTTSTRPPHQMFIDMPQGDHKKRAKYRFASKTLMRILPSGISSEIEGLIEKKAISLDLYEILGACTWDAPK